MFVMCCECVCVCMWCEIGIFVLRKLMCINIECAAQYYHSLAVGRAACVSVLRLFFCARGGELERFIYAFHLACIRSET